MSHAQPKKGKGTKVAKTDLRSLAFSSSTGVKKKKRRGNKGRGATSGQPQGTSVEAPAPAPVPSRAPAAPSADMERKVSARRTQQFEADMADALRESLQSASAADVAAVWADGSSKTAGKGKKKKSGRKGQVTLQQHMASTAAPAPAAPPGLSSVTDGVAIVGGKVVAVAGKGVAAPPGLSADELVQRELQRVRMQETAAAAAAAVNTEAAQKGEVAYDRSRADIKPLGGSLPGIADQALDALPPTVQRAVRLAAAHEQTVATKGRGGVGAVQVPRSVPVPNGDMVGAARLFSLLFSASALQQEQLAAAQRTIEAQQKLLNTGMTASQASLASSVQQLQAENASLGQELGKLHSTHSRALGAMRRAGIDTSEYTIAPEAPKRAGAASGSSGKGAAKGRRGGKRGGKGRQGAPAEATPASLDAVQQLTVDPASVPKIQQSSLAALNAHLKAAVGGGK